MINCAVVGVRNRGRHVVREIQACSDMQVTHLCDADEQRLVAAREDAPKAQLLSDAKEVFADESVEVVYLILPNHLHAPLGIAALQAGKHVYLEKPMACSLEECRDLIAARDAAGRELMISYQQRFSDAATQARALLATGKLGKITSARARWNRRVAGEGLWGRGDWFLDPAISGGGPFIDIGVHKLDLCLDLLDYPRIDRLVAKAGYGIGKRVGKLFDKNYAIEDSMDAWLFTDDVDIKVESSYFRNQEEEEYHDVELLGEFGGLRISQHGLESWLVGEKGELLPLGKRQENGCSASQHFSDVLNGRATLRPTADQSYVLQQIVEASYHSAKNKSSFVEIKEEIIA